MALRILDGAGATQYVPTWVDPTYVCSVSGIVPGAAPTTIWQFQGAAGVVCRIKRMVIGLRSGSAAGASLVSINRYSTAASGGTPVVDTTYITKADPSDPASALLATGSIKHYTAAPTAGTLVNALWKQNFGLSGTSTDATYVFQTIDFATNGAKPIVVRGILDFITVDSATALGTAQKFDITVEWEEGTV